MCYCFDLYRNVWLLTQILICLLIILSHGVGVDLVHSPCLIRYNVSMTSAVCGRECVCVCAWCQWTCSMCDWLLRASRWPDLARQKRDCQMKRSLWYMYKVKVMSELQNRRDLSNHDLTVDIQRVDQIKKLLGKCELYREIPKIRCIS